MRTIDRSSSLKQRIFYFLKSRLGRVLIAATLGASTALACGWSYITDHSVRFNSFRTGPGFYRLPPLPIAVDPVTGKEQSVAEIENYYDSMGEGDTTSYDEEQAALSKPEEIWEKAMAASEASDISSLEKNLRDYLEMTRYRYIDGPDRKRRNTAIDILDALGELRNGSGASSVMAYVKARTDHLSDVHQTDDVMPNSTADLNLSDNWAYLRAAELYDANKKDEALAAFKEHLSRFPQSEKNEAAMYMIGRIKLEQSYSFEAHNCGIQGKTGGWNNEEIDPAKIEDPKLCRDKNWHDAKVQFKQMLRKFPDGRYSLDARGWIAFLDKRGGYRAEALAEYYRLLGQTRDLAWRLEAKKSLQIIGHEYDDETLDKVEALIAGEPETALAYAYHRIYNHAVDLSYVEFDDWCCGGDDEWTQRSEERKRVKDATDKGRHELERIAKFAAAMVKRYGTSRVSGDFLLRVAEAKLELRDLAGAQAFSQKAIANGIAGDERAQALWVKGSSEHGQKKFSAARASFSQLIKEFPDNKLTEGARRLLAITAEDQDDLETALEQYLALKYDYDVAYFIDVLMPADRLAKFVESHKDSDDHNFLLYGLGVRYMRDRRWNEARDTLRRVTAISSPNADLYSEVEDRAFAKAPDTWSEDHKRAIRAKWVMRDIQTVDDLERLETAANNAEGDEAKAEAMYQLASYQFDADDLLFYNPAAWDGMRHELLSGLNFSDHFRLPGESENLLNYSKSHETLARAIPIYLDIVDRYPNTKAAKDALFSAVVAQEKLSNMNDYWRDIYGSGLFAGQRMVGNSDIRRMFPKFKWPISRLGWEAATRTVNGGSAYPPPPKPLPKISRADRAKRKLEAWYAEYAPAVEKRVSTISAGITQISTAAADHVLNRLYMAYAGLMFYIFWTNRRELYEGPVAHGVEYGRRAYLRYRKLRPGGPPGPLSILPPLLYSEKCSDENDNGDINKPGGDGRDNGGGGKTPA